MNNLFRRLLCCAILSLPLAACHDTLNGNGNISIQVNYEGSGVAQAIVYLTRDSLFIPDSLGTAYDYVQLANGSGEVVFNDIAAGQYYIYAAGNETEDHQPVQGTDSVTVMKRYRQNNYYVMVNTRRK